MKRFAVLLFASLAAWPLRGEAAPSVRLGVTDYVQTIVYHSPDIPGYSAWVGLWRRLDGRLQCSFEQRTKPTSDNKNKYDSTWVVLESPDDGRTWDGAPGGLPRGDGRGTVVLSDGTLVRPNSMYLSVFPDPPGSPITGSVERSTDGGKTWSRPICFLPPEEYRTWPTRMRQLRDGRLVLMAGVWKRGDGDGKKRMTKMMFVSKDGGKSWGPPVVLMPTEQGVCEESDFCELPNGDLFWIHRVEHFPAAPVRLPPLAAPLRTPHGYSDRMQSIVYKRGDLWEAGSAIPAPFPHSGYPLVLFTRERVILHVATDGIYWSGDIGKTWRRLPIPGAGYYPQGLQLPNGTIVTLGHIGSDDIYGTVDQSVVQQSFRLKVKEP